MGRGKVIVISIDAMFNSDVEVMRKKKNLGRLFSNSSMVERVHCIYPTYTYPCHASIMTGCYPNRHGICHNELFQINKDSHDWYWWAKDIKVPTMVDVAKENGLTTATVCWPVMGGKNVADYTIAEIWAPKREDDPTPRFDEANSPNVKHIFEKHKSELNHMKTPEFDNFATGCAVDIIKEFSPDLLFVHLSYVDHQRHNCGIETEKILHAIDFVDEKVGEIIKAVEETGNYDDTTFVVLGDHGHMMVNANVQINQILAQKGYITHDGEKVIDWKIMAHPSSFSAEIYTKDIDKDEAKKVLEEIQKEYPQYIERVMTRFEVEEIYHLSGAFDFVIEGVNNIIFGPSLTGDFVRKPQKGDYKTSVSTHGFAPEKGDNPPFVICGNKADAGKRVKEARLVDEAPTIMKLFGIEMKNTDGKVIKGLLK